MSGDAFADALLVVSRLFWYAGMLGVIGACAFRVLIGRAARQRAVSWERAAVSIGLIAAVVLLIGIGARLYAQAYAAFGIEERLTPGLLWIVATDLPPWSTGWMLQLAAGSFSAAAIALAAARVRLAWGAAFAGAVMVAASAPLTGHAVGQADWYALPVALQAGHVLGAGIWIGGLLVLYLAALRRKPDAPSIAALVHGFSPLALGGAGLLTLTGVVTVLVYLRAPAELWTTGYGRTLLLKIAMFAAVAAMGFVNWRHIRPRLTGAGGAALLRRSAALELALAALVLAVTAVLVGLPQPGEE